MSGRIPYDVHGYPFDLIVVGAGINGAGIARDAAMRGLKVLLLDKEDLAGGTTSWSTRLIHGGLRYLEHYEFALVRESLSEREKLLHIAPHLVKPLPFLVPVYEGGRRRPNLVRAGMLLYDALSSGKSMPRHRMPSRQEALEIEPDLNPEGLRAAALYHDGQAEYAERLAVENAVSAREHGALVLTYARVERLIREGGKVTGVEFTDFLEGGSYRARAPLTVNAAGPWVDEVLGKLEGSPRPMIGGTKGSHVVVDHFPGAPRKAIYTEARADSRPYFIIPWNGRYLIGTTDLRYGGDLDHVRAEDHEIDYLIDETNRVIPRANLTREDVLFTYSGVRPLPYAPEGSEGSITRSHVIHDHAENPPIVGGLVSIIGGKLTTYRNLARQTVDVAFRKLGREPPECRTDRIPLPGGTTGDFSAFAAGFKAESGLSEEVSQRLLDLYGARAPQVLREADDDPSLKTPLSPNPNRETALLGAEVLYAFRREMARTLSDVLLRRTMVALGPDTALDLDEAAARVAAAHLGWSNEKVEKEVCQFRSYIRRFRPKSLQNMKGKNRS